MTIEPNAIYTAPEVGRLLFGHSADWFYRQRKTLERTEGFPPPVSTIGRPRWSGATLLAWRDRPDRAPASAADRARDMTNVDDITELLRARAKLVARSGRRKRKP